MTQKNIASIDNSCRKPVSLTHPLPAGAPNARHAQPQFPFNRRRIGFAASITSSWRNSLIRKNRSFRTKNISPSAKIPAKTEIVPITRVIRPSSRQIRPIGQQGGPKWSRLSVHSVSFPSLLAVCVQTSVTLFGRFARPNCQAADLRQALSVRLTVSVGGQCLRDLRDLRDPHFGRGVWGEGVDHPQLRHNIGQAF